MSLFIKINDQLINVYTKGKWRTPNIVAIPQRLRYIITELNGYRAFCHRMTQMNTYLDMQGTKKKINKNREIGETVL